MNTLNGASLLASAAAGTLIIINCCKIILNGDRAVRTGLLTLHTTDTTVRACLTGNRTLIVAGALNNNSGRLCEHMNNALRTGLGAKATADTSNGINLCNAVITDVNSILGTNGYTIAVAKTSISTLGISGVSKLCCLTGLDTVVNVLSILCLALTVTSNKGNLLLYVAGSETHDLSNLLCYVSTTGGTEAGIISLSLTESSGIAVTTGEATSTAVCAGKAITNCSNALVYLNSEEGSGKSKNDSANKRDNNKNY